MLESSQITNKKTKKRKRNLPYFGEVHKADEQNIKRLLAMK